MAQTDEIGDFAERLRLAMKKPRVTNRALAAHVGVHETTVSGWVTGRIVPERERIALAAEYLKVPVAWLAYGDESSAPDLAAPVRGRARYRYQGGPVVVTQDRESERAVDSETAVSSEIASGQRELARWIAEYSARLLEAAAVDARRQAEQLFEPTGHEHVHDGNDAEVARLHRAITAAATDASAGGARETAPRRTKRSSG